MRVIGLTGKKRHGKTLFCGYLGLKLPEYRTINFKDSLLEMAYSIGWNGEKDDRGRKLLQRLDTDVCRECIDQDYWVTRWFERVSFVSSEYVLVDDVRFNNEAAAIKALNGMIIKVVTPGLDDLGDFDNHISEAGILDSYIDVVYSLEYGLKYITQAAEAYYVTYLNG